MSPQYVNHLTALEQAIRTKPDNPAFKVPSENGGWRDISYQELWNDVVRLAVYYSSRLEQLGMKKRDVIGLCLQRAGYIPHLMSTYVKDLDLVQGLFQQSNAKTVICDTTRINGWEQLEPLGVKVIPILTHEEVAQITGSCSPVDLSVLPPLDEEVDGNDILSFEQSSGSSSGRPKLVPFSRRWVDANAQKCQIDERRTPVFIRSGSFCYVGQLLRAS
ncbi:hypothetical protein Clacol_003320 [Clathrus columnatus]|uniref:AMP-dependent synthetase/ligase domain-containing protein n=1 Tax=Clathrus columnatus TaxID=1419009 RepID=A0AAV5A7A5_9AGAM|nr:hypothetical protein Clacol_003320 [Clathrus columnatus]